MKPLLAEFAGVEGAAKLVQLWALLIQHLISRRVEKDQMPRALEAVRKTHVTLPFLGVEGFERDDH